MSGVAGLLDVVGGRRLFREKPGCLLLTGKCHHDRRHGLLPLLLNMLVYGPCTP